MKKTQRELIKEAYNLLTESNKSKKMEEKLFIRRQRSCYELGNCPETGTFTVKFSGSTEKKLLIEAGFLLAN